MKLCAILAISIQFLAAQTTYENHGGYAYKVKIPVGLTAVKAPPPAPAHGFAIHLDPPTASKVFVDGTYNALLHASAREAAEANANDLGDTLIGRVEFQSAKLAGLPAVRTTLRYHDKKTGAVRHRTAIIALRGNPAEPNSIEYEILLDTTPTDAPKHLPVFEALRKSFRLTRADK